MILYKLKVKELKLNENYYFEYKKKPIQIKLVIISFGNIFIISI